MFNGSSTNSLYEVYRLCLDFNISSDEVLAIENYGEDEDLVALIGIYNKLGGKEKAKK